MNDCRLKNTDWTLREKQRDQFERRLNFVRKGPREHLAKQKGARELSPLISMLISNLHANECLFSEYISMHVYTLCVHIIPMHIPKESTWVDQ